MHPTVDKIVTAAKAHLDTAAKSAARIDPHKLAWGGLVLAGITFLAVNLFASTAFRGVKADLTRDGLYTISDGTRKALRAIDEPIDIRVYFSKRLGEAAPTYAKNFDRVRSLLERYRDISGGKLKVSFHDPEPFSDAEDRAVAAGLRGVRLNQEGDQGYFGMVGTNATDNEASIGFFSTDRERFLEYDVTKLVYTLANPKKRVIGMISSIPLDGAMPAMMRMGAQPTPPQMVMEQIREFFDVKTLEKDVKEIPADIDVLMLVQPEGLTPEAAYAIDQYALKGGKVLVFIDPLAETSQRGNPMMGMPGGPPDTGEIEKLLKSWGVAYDPTKLTADISYARRVQFGGGMRANVTDYVVWLSLDRKTLDERDVLSAGIERLNLASAGSLAKAEGASTEVSPILITSDKAMQVGTEKIGPQPDAVGLLRNYKPEGKLVLAARISGKANSAFPDGVPKAAEAKKDEPATKPGVKEVIKGAAKGAEAKGSDKPAEPSKPGVASGNLNVIVIADTDMLNDQFWVEVRDFLGQQVAIPNAHNSSFVLAALENLSGSDALISLRGRGIIDRPFELVERIRRDSERRFRDKEAALTAKLKDVQEQLGKLEKASQGENLVLSDADRAAIEKFRAELLVTRRDLREVKRELRKDIDQLDGWLKFVNIAGVPLLIGVGGVGWAAYRRRRKPDATPPADR
ncbi:MAG TPA: Gldg family protein [Hyphomicrobiaceae bacterium]|nr:Gldg family protein [Hyphomicrobiaceae bacterium]